MQSRQHLLDGASLALAVNFARKVTIVQNDGLRGHVQLAMQADTDAELDSIDVFSGKAAGIRQKPQSGGNDDNIQMTGIFNVFVGRVFSGDVVGGRSGSQQQPTLEMTLQVPVGFPLDLTASGKVRMTSDVIGGPLRAVLSASAFLQAESCVDAHIAASSSAEAHIKAVSGTAEFKASSSAEIASESGVLDRLVIEASSNTTVTHAGTTRALEVEASSSAEVLVDEVRGTPEMASTAKLEASSSSRIRVRSGDVAQLRADASSAANIKVGATVGRGRASASSAGSIKVEEVTSSDWAVSTSSAGSVKVMLCAPQPAGMRR